MVRLLLCFIAFTMAGCTTTDDFPQRTDDGLERIPTSKVMAAYQLPEADFSGYRRVQLAPCQVAFRKDWLRDYNRDSAGPRLRTEDMDEIAEAVAEQFAEVFSEELSKRGYQVVEADVKEADVLLLKPAIVNLDVTAPDVPSASIQRNYVSSAGEMTLYLELHDAQTNALLARSVDHREATDLGFYQRANRVTNRQELRRILRRWADLLADGLDEARR